MKDEIEKYDYQMQEPGFWDDVDKSQEIMKTVKSLKDTVEAFEALETEFEDIDTMIQMAEEEEDDSSLDGWEDETIE